MLGLENLESRKASALIAALDDQEITVKEFSDAIRFLKSEALQVTAFVLSTRALDSESIPQRLRTARDMCSQLAAKSRMLS